MKDILEFKKQIGFNNVYFSAEMENALREYGFKTKSVQIHYKGKIIGIISNYYRKYKISYPPFLFPFYGFYVRKNFLTRHPEKSISLLKSITKTQKRNFIFSLFSLSPEITDIRAFKENGWKESVKYTYRIYRGNEILKSSKKRKLRDISVSDFNITEAKNPNTLYGLISIMNRSKQRSTPYDSEYLNLIFSNLTDKQRTIYEIYNNGICLASAFILRDNLCSYLFANAIHEKIRNSNINLYFLKQIIEKELEINNCFDLQGANTPSIVKFKENFNARLTPYFQVKTGLDITGLIKIKGKLKKWLNR